MLTGVCAAAIAVFSLVPSPDLGAGIPHADKAAHLTMYAVMAWLLMRSVRAMALVDTEYAWLSWIFATSYGMLLEVLQLMVPWRSADWWDIGVNALGAAAGVFLGSDFFSNRLTRKDAHSPNDLGKGV